MPKTLEKTFEKMMDTRLTQTLEHEARHDRTYALALRHHRELADETRDILEGNSYLHLSGLDRDALRDLVASYESLARLEASRALRQGYKDGAALLRWLGMR